MGELQYYPPPRAVFFNPKPSRLTRSMLCRFYRGLTHLPHVTHPYPFSVIRVALLNSPVVRRHPVRHSELLSGMYLLEAGQ